jgi:hypothetical protein
MYFYIKLTDPALPIPGGLVGARSRPSALPELKFFQLHHLCRPNVERYLLEFLARHNRLVHLSFAGRSAPDGIDPAAVLIPPVA